MYLSIIPFLGPRSLLAGQEKITDHKIVEWVGTWLARKVLRPSPNVNALHSVMNSMPPTRPTGTPVSKVYLDAYRPRPSEPFGFSIHPLAHWRCARFGVGELSAINGIAGCECVSVWVPYLPLAQA